MGFSFYMGFTADTGLSLYDIRYDGQRILYELGLQETLSHYAGECPHILLLLIARVPGVNICRTKSPKETTHSTRAMPI